MWERLGFRPYSVRVGLVGCGGNVRVVSCGALGRIGGRRIVSFRRVVLRFVGVVIVLVIVMRRLFLVC